MAYSICEIRVETFPDPGLVEAAFLKLGLPLADLLGTFERYCCAAPLNPGQGYQMDIAADLEQHLERELRREGLRPSRRRHDLTYSPALNQHADFALVHEASKQRALFEIEFRPNYEKDLIKFQIGHNSGVLAAGVMIVAIDRKTINPVPPLYPSMPEYRSVISVLRELKPQYPLVVIGILGQHAA